MKKTAILAAVVLLCMSFAAAGYGAGAMYNGYPVVNVTVNGQPVTSDVPAIVMDGRTMLPVGAVADALGMIAEYDATTNTVSLNRSREKEPDHQYYEIRSNDLKIGDGSPYLCYVVDGKVYIPVTAIGEYYSGFNGLKITFNMPDNGTVTVNAIEIQGRKCINPQDLGLNVDLQDNVLWINY